MVLLDIFVKVILPIFLLIGVGTLLDRKLNLDLATMNKLNFYAFVPGFIFIKIIDADLGFSSMLHISLFAFVHVMAMLVLCLAVFSWGPLSKKRTLLTLSSILSNCGNYGIPFAALAFGDEMVAVMAGVIMTHNLLSFTLAVWMLERESRKGGLAAFAGMFKIPVVYAIFIAFVMRAFDLSLPHTIHEPLNYLSEGLIALALMTLGVQLGRCRFRGALAPTAASTAMRLVVAPLVAAALIPLFGFEPAVARVLVVTAGLPMAVNVFILCLEYRHNEDLASQGIFWSTLVSAATLTLWLVIF